MSARRRRHATRWVAGAVMLVLVVVGVVLATRTPQQATAVQSPLLGRTAPQFTGTDLNTGSPVSLVSLRGHYVVINFFASWCIPCQEEAPDLSRFHYEQAHAADGADMVSVVFHDTSDTASAFLRAERRPLARRERPRRCDRPELWGDGAAHDLCHRSVRPRRRGARWARRRRRTSTRSWPPPRRSRRVRPMAERTTGSAAVGSRRAAARRPRGGARRGQWPLRHRTPDSRSQRAAAIEAGVRCPSCTDVSVAQSNATTAIAVRHQVESMVAQGRSTRRHRPGARVRVRPDHPAWCRPTLGASPSSGSSHWSPAPARWWASLSSSGAGAAPSTRSRAEETVRVTVDRIAGGGGTRTDPRTTTAGT